MAPSRPRDGDPTGPRSPPLEAARTASPATTPVRGPGHSWVRLRPNHPRLLLGSPPTKQHQTGALPPHPQSRGHRAHIPAGPRGRRRFTWQLHRPRQPRVSPPPLSATARRTAVVAARGRKLAAASEGGKTKREQTRLLALTSLRSLHGPADPFPRTSSRSPAMRR